jgi:hypothetical protein
VVCEGWTVVEPDIFGVTEPTLLMENDVASAEEYESVDGLPGETVEGERETLHDGVAVTVTVVCAYDVHVE